MRHSFKVWIDEKIVDWKGLFIRVTSRLVIIVSNGRLLHLQGEILSSMQNERQNIAKILTQSTIPSSWGLLRLILVRTLHFLGTDFSKVGLSSRWPNSWLSLERCTLQNLAVVWQRALQDNQKRLLQGHESYRRCMVKLVTFSPVAFTIWAQITTALQLRDNKCVSSMSRLT